MSNLFRIDFVMGDTTHAQYNQTMHSLIDTQSERKIITLSRSADKLASVSNYTREPRRLRFECFVNDWITEYLLSGDYEFERYISKFIVKAYRDGALLFTGIIVTSQMSFDVSTQILKFTCYDFIKLFSIYSDLNQLFAITTGYSPVWLVGYFIERIQARIPIQVQYYDALEKPEIALTDYNIGSVKFSGLEEVPDDAGEWSYWAHTSSWEAPKYGFIIDPTSERATFCFAHMFVIVAHHASGSNYYRARCRGRIYRYYNNICPKIYEYDETSSWYETIDELETDYQDFLAFFAEYGVSSSQIDSLVTSGTINGNQYSAQLTAHVSVVSTFSGDAVPAKLHPGKYYEGEMGSKTDNLKALQAMLLLCNATVYCTNTGIIILRDKDNATSEIIDIDTDSVESLTTQRADHELPDTSTLDVLAGDTSTLAELVRDRESDSLNDLWQIDVQIDDLSRYSLGLFTRISLQDVTYMICEIEEDWINDGYKLKAWRKRV